MQDGDSIEIQAQPGSEYSIEEENGDTNCTVSVSVNGEETQQVEGKLENNLVVVFTNTYPVSGGEEHVSDQGTLKINKITEGKFDSDRIFAFRVLTSTGVTSLEQAGQAEQNLLRQADSSDPSKEPLTLTSSTNTDDEKQLATGGRIDIGGGTSLTKEQKEQLVKLEAGASDTIVLPVGWYLVEELEAEDCEVFYNLNGSGLVAKSTKGLKWFPGRSIIVKVEKDKKTTVTFKNVKVEPGFVTVKKTVTGEGADPKEKFDFVLTWSLEESEESAIGFIKDEDIVREDPTGPLGVDAALSDTSLSGSLTREGQLSGSGKLALEQKDKELTKTKSGKKEFSLGDGEQVTFDDIPRGAVITVIEVDTSNLVGIKVDGLEVETATGTVEAGKTLAIEFENKRIPAPAADDPDDGGHGSLVAGDDTVGTLVAGDTDTIIPATGVRVTTLLMGLGLMEMGLIALFHGGRMLKRREE